MKGREVQPVSPTITPASSFNPGSQDKYKSTFTSVQATHKLELPEISTETPTGQSMQGEMHKSRSFSGYGVCLPRSHSTALQKPLSYLKKKSHEQRTRYSFRLTWDGAYY